MRQLFIVLGLIFCSPVFSGAVSTAGQSITVKVKPGQTLLGLFKSHKLMIHDYYQMKKNLKPAETKVLADLFPGQIIYFDVDKRRVLKLIVYQKNGAMTEIIKRGNDYIVETKSLKVEKYTGVGFSIKSSLYVDGLARGLKMSHIKEAVDIITRFSNFSVRSLQSGTTIQLYLEGMDLKKAEPGHVIAMDIITRGKRWQVTKYWLGNSESFYTPSGEKALNFIRYPVEKFRVSSSFSPNRMHPVLKIKRPHYGVDLATTRGAPVKCSADGKVDFIGARGGYGKTVVINHGAGFKTVYAHLSGYKKGLKRGDRVAQKDVLGFVGSTGVATGPHLHYEVRKNGVALNPVKFEVQTVEKVLGVAYPLFLKYHDFIRSTVPISSRLSAKT